MFSHEIQIGNLIVGQNRPARIMGVINLSPESFYGESIVNTEDNLLQTVDAMIKAGVDLIDIGGASTAPEETYGNRRTTLKKELERVVWGMDILKDVSKVPISIDTTSSKVAETALELGASLVNDISGFQHDRKMVNIVREREVPVVLMAQCRPSCKSLEDSLEALRKSLNIALKGGIDRSRIILDPGIGFGKPAEADFCLLRELRLFSLLKQPLLVGVSRKAFIDAILGQANPSERLIGTIAATTISVANGASIVRAHDVREAKMAAKIGKTLSRRRMHSKSNVALLEIENEKEYEILIEQVGVKAAIKKALSKKGGSTCFLLQDMTPPAALIIKQEMLALGGDAVYHHDTIDFGIDKTDVLIMGTALQLERLISKLSKMKYFGLRKIAALMMELLEERRKSHW